MLTLYDYYRSSASFRVRIALNLKGLQYDVEPIHLLNNGGEQHSHEYRAINPQAFVPTLQDGNRILTQSLAIIEYLDEKYPTPPLLPKDIYFKALARSYALIIAADIHPLNNLRVSHYLKTEYNITDQQKMRWYKHWIESGLTALEAQLQKHKLSGDFCLGDQPSIADVCLVPQLYNARRFECDLDAFPMLVHIDSNCQQHTAFMEAWPTEPVTQ